MASNVHLGNGNAAGNPEFETESEIPATVVEAAPEKELQPVADCPTVTELTTAVETTVPNKKRRGDCLFRVIVPVHKVESIIGRNGDLIERMCQETKAHIKVLVVPVSYPSRVVQISSKEDREAPLSPAMDAVIRVFKLINGFPENESDGVPSNSPCSIRLLVPSVQAMSLIEMQGSSINTIHKDVGFSSCRFTGKKERISAKSDDRVVELQGKGLKVLKALKAVLEHLRMLLVDHSIPPLFKNTVTKRVAVSRYKAGDIIGVEGTNIANIGRTSGAVLTVHESNNRIAVELKGNPSQVKAATQLLDIQIKTVNDRARPAVLNKPISQPQEGTTLGFCPTDVDQALTGSPELPQVQIATAPKPIETKAEVPPELPQVQPATALKAVETKPVMRASSDDSNVVEEALQQVEAEEPVIPTRPELVGPAILDGMAHISESKRSRVSWEDENVDKTFLDACIHEIAINGRESGSLNAKSWKKVGEILKERHNFCVDHKQMKNYFDALESRYKSWLMLKNKIDNIYDPSLDDEMKKNKYIETLKNESPPLPDLCAKLFDGALSKSFVETRIQKDTMSIASPSSPVDYKKRKGEVTHEPQAAGPLVPPSAQTSVPEAPVEPQKEPKRIRVCWNVNTAKTFLEACIHEITFNGREAGSLKAMSWKKVEEILKDRHNFSVDSNQMKSYFNGLKNKYKAWLLLKNKFGNKYDSSTNKFNFTEKEWETEMKKNKCIESLRKAPLRFPDLCAQLFDDVISTSFFQTAATSPSAETSPPLAATETRHEGECEVQELCSSLLQVPAELPQVQTATALNTIETKVEAPPEVPQVQPATALKAVETTVEVPPELPEVQPANALEAIDTKIEVPPETPEVQPATALKAMETEAEVPTKLPQVQPASAPEAIETKPQEPVLLAKTGTGEAFLGPVRPVVLNCPDFHPPDQTAPGVDQDLTGLACHSKKRCCPMLSLPQVAAGPLGTNSIKESKRNRYLWNDDIVKTFLDECIREIAINGQDGGSLKAVSWKKVGEILKATHNYYADTKQMKNYFDGLKSKYIAWLSLKNKFGNKYDPATNTFNLTDKEWGTEIKKNKCIEELRLGPLRFPDLCAQLFDGVISTGVDQPLTGPEPGEIIEPQEAVPFVPPSAETSPPSAATEAPVEPQKEPIMCSSLVEVPPELPPVQAPSEVVEIQIKRPMSVFEEEMLDVLKVIADKINRPQPPSKPTFEDCEKKLNELGWRKNDPLYLVALTIFCDKNNHYRELWMKLNPNLCADWVRMIGRSKGFT